MDMLQVSSKVTLYYIQDMMRCYPCKLLSAVSLKLFWKQWGPW